MSLWSVARVQVFVFCHYEKKKKGRKAYQILKRILYILSLRHHGTC